MAEYRCSLKPRLSRRDGASVVKSVAYIGRDKLHDERGGKQYDYSAKKEDVLFAGAYAPKGAPAWAQDIEKLANEIERAEKRKDAQLALPLELSLAHELTVEQNRWMMQDFIRENFTRKGYATIAAIHAPPEGGDPRNIHAHLLVSLRTINEEGFAKTKKQQQDNFRNNSAYAEALRQSWEKHLKHHLERHGFHEQAAEVSCRSLEAQGKDREPQVHLGPTASQMNRRGAATERGELNQEIEARNELREHLKAEEKTIGKELAEAREHQESVADFKQHQEQAKYERQAERLEESRKRSEPPASREAKKAGHAAERGVIRAGHVTGRLSDGFMKAVDSALDLLVGALPQKQYTPAELARDPAARRALYAQEAKEREGIAVRNSVIDKWDEELKKNGNDYSRLCVDDVRFLTGADLEHVRAYNQDAIARMLRDREKQREMEVGRMGRHRERD